MTRIAVISDIHGNVVAFEAVLADIKRQAVDQVICLGDVAALGAQPAEAIALLKSLQVPCILGNHEDNLFMPEIPRSAGLAPAITASVYWCRDHLSSPDLDFLRGFAPTITLSVGNGTQALCFHGSPQSNTDMILAATPEAELKQMLGAYPEPVLIGGHTHVQMVRQHLGQLIINPGSVGLAFRKAVSPDSPPELLRWAEYAIVTEDQHVLSVDLRRVPFNIAATRQLVAQTDLPLKSWLLEQYA